MISLISGRKKKKDHRYREQFGGCQKRGMGVLKMGEGGQNVQTSTYKINKSWRCNIQSDDYI